eukprot:2051968-Amphidinium_carterae.1
MYLYERNACKPGPYKVYHNNMSVLPDPHRGAWKRICDKVSAAIWDNTHTQSTIKNEVGQFKHEVGDSNAMLASTT